MVLGGPLTKLLASDGEGERLDRFELVAELASGGMATVFLARLNAVAGFQRLYAIKRLHPHLQREQEFVDMFLDEARLAARIHHPNVVPILEVGESKRGYYLVMEYIEGDTLAHLLARSAQKQTKLPVDVSVRIALDTLAGLDAAHELRDDHDAPLEVVHRDVSPQNILVGIDGTTRLTDFGVARAAARLTITRTGQLKGKLAYMAPEQARGQGVDRRADLFALGIVLWEAFTMKRLFKGDGEAETLSRVLTEPIPKLRTVNPTLPAGIEAVVMKALERDPAKRFATASDFADALERAARAVRALGGPKDVAACLDSLMGADLTEQRAAVRTWLAQSEPSPSRVKRKSDSITRIEGRKAEENRPDSSSEPPPDVAASGSLPAQSLPATSERSPASSSSMPLISAAQASAVFGAPASLSASSLSTVIEPPDAPPPRRRRPLWPSMLAASVLGGGVVGLVLRLGSPAVSNTAPAAQPLASAPSLVSPTLPSSTGLAPRSTTDLEKPPVAPSASSGPKAVPTWRQDGPKHLPTDKPKVPPQAPSAGPIPDDISNNPYR